LSTNGQQERGKGMSRKTIVIVLGISVVLFGIGALLQDPLRLHPALSAVVVEIDSGEILYQHNAEKRIPPASLTKLMTVLLAVEAIESRQVDLLDLVSVSEYAASMEGSRVWLGAGECYTVEQLLMSLMIASANDAAVAIAEYLGGNEPQFVSRMMERADELGMQNTRFVNATGLPAPDGEEEGFTTATDMARLAQEVLCHRQILEWSRTPSQVLRENPLFVMRNTNPLLGTYPGCDGLKTGHTEAAGYHLIATAKRNGVRLISVIMHTNSRRAQAAASTRLLDYGFRKCMDTPELVSSP